MGLRYALGEIAKHGLDRTWWRKRFLTHVTSRYYAFRGVDSDPITGEDWDNLLILDACRYDLFEEVYEANDLPGDLSKRKSVDTATPGFLEKTFDGETFHDIVYVNANPYLRIVLDREQFHAVEDVWEDAWDETEQTVMPSVMAERALAAAERYPDKRLIVHFLQPHYPFVGETRLGKRQVFSAREHALGNDGVVQDSTPFQRLERGEVSYDDLWAAYRSNLEAALPAVTELMESLHGKTAVTSDHGNALGERASPFPIRVYGHPLGTYIPALTEVPWLVTTDGERKDVTAEPPVETDRSVDEDTEERLRMLGYAE